MTRTKAISWAMAYLHAFLTLVNIAQDERGLALWTALAGTGFVGAALWPKDGS